MKVIYPTGTQVQYYGRNPLYLIKGYDAGAVGPHINTQRAIYTCPAGRKAVITGLYNAVMRLTVAAPVAEYSGYFDITIGGSGFKYCWITQNNNVAYVRVESVSSGLIWLNPADTIEYRTVDQSTGGAVFYKGTLVGVEFDP